MKTNWLAVSKLTSGIWRSLTRALVSLKNLHFNELLLNKVYNAWAKKVQRSSVSLHEKWCKIWRKTDLWFGKWHDQFGKFLLEHSKVLKLGLCWDGFIQSRKCMSLKFTEELCVMAIRMMQNLKRNWLVVSKLTWGIWQILTQALESLKDLHCNGFLLNKVEHVWV